MTLINVIMMIINMMAVNIMALTNIMTLINVIMMLINVITLINAPAHVYRGHHDTQDGALHCVNRDYFGARRTVRTAVVT